MAEEQVLLDKQDNVGIITINNPPVNSMSGEIVSAIDTKLAKAIADDEIKFIIIIGQGDRVFASGADLKELGGFDAATASKTISVVQNLSKNILDCPKPTIAALNGVAFGGGLEIALCCDFRVAIENGLFGLPEIKLGVLPGAGGIQLLPALVGLPIARWLIYSGEGINSSRALEIGLIDRMAKDDGLMEEAINMGNVLAANGPVAYAAIKKSLMNRLNMPFSEAVAEDINLFAKLCETEDKAEGVRAFMEKRKPVFSGK
jgi:enoyl-CoA hydratase